jgi:hypothetical protein
LKVDIFLACVGNLRLVLIELLYLEVFWFGLHKMTKPYLDGQRKMDFLKADDSLLCGPPTKQGEKHKDNKKKEAKSALFLIC